MPLSHLIFLQPNYVGKWFSTWCKDHYTNICSGSSRKLNGYKLAARARGNVDFIVFSLSVKPFSYGSTSIEKIMEFFSKVKVEDCQHDYT
ncbi:hypothetical protein H5410_030330 [Solanum commersonii]|uniref:Uncharacterized protein n=1 Tax=Solanum commersonii TaxID=4109 RepID=A0A9J5YH49_SOLCO|nr:hypothetical protein H5410_030330 [Solanum commersonii]